MLRTALVRGNWLKKKRYVTEDIRAANRHTQPILEMRKYLALAPDAPNPLSLQDRIYAWEDEAKRWHLLCD